MNMAQWDDRPYDPTTADAALHVIIEVCILALLALLVSIRGEYLEEKHHFVLHSNIMTMLILRGGAAYLVAEYVYGFEDSLWAAVIAWLIVFYLLRQILPLTTQASSEVRKF